MTQTPRMCRWLIAVGKRPVPFRTRKLSPPALMVLHPGGCGRVSYRRPKNTNKQLHNPTRHPHNTVTGAALLLHTQFDYRISPPHTTRENTKQIPQSSNQPARRGGEATCLTEQGFGEGDVGVAGRREAAGELGHWVAEGECDSGEHHGFAEVFTGGR